MAGHLQTLLQSFVAQPDSHLAELKMLTAREENWLIREVNQTGAADSPGLCAHQVFEQQVRGLPETRRSIIPAGPFPIRN